MIATRPRLVAVLSLSALLLAACAGKKDAEKPAKLVDIQDTVKIDRVWSASVRGEAKLRLGLSLATDGNAVFAAGHDGSVVAFNAGSGKRLWQTSTKLPLTGGPGAGEGLVVAGGSHGQIVALDAATGAQKWRTYISSEVLAAPAIGGGVVLVRLADGRVVALSVADGKELWSAAQTVPRLSLRGTARPTIVGDQAVCGFDTGRVMALSLADGSTVWDASFAPPSGKSEIERLIDMDSAVSVAGSDVFAVAYHGKAARIDRDTGQVLWTRDVSSYAGLAADADAVYVSSSEGNVVKIGRRNGELLWGQSALANRRLSPPSMLGPYLLVADLEGYVHVLDPADGRLIGRSNPLNDRVTSQPLVIGDMLVMMDARGRIVALRARPAEKG